MAENPREVIVVLINTTVTSIQIKDGLEQANLIDSLYSHTFGAPWPTLGKLIQDRDRLVLFSNSPDTGPGFSWLHPSSQYIAQTSLPTSRSNFDCAAPVTDPANMFYLLQHRVTSGFIVPTSNEDSARAVNSFEVLRKRIDDCTLSSDKRPNFIAVDYYTVGDLFGVCNSYLPIE